jgi:hypothetical protein
MKTPKKSTHNLPKLCSLLLLSSCLSWPSIANTIDINPDSDQDGVPDQIEIELGLDPFNFDSDMNGISDFDQVQLMSADLGLDVDLESLKPFESSQLFSRALIGSTQNSQLSAQAGADPDRDTDGDGLSDFLETYGYYIADNTPTSLPRTLTVEHWQNLKADPYVAQGVHVFGVALERLEQDLRANYDAQENRWIVSLDGAKNSIIQAYIEAGISPTSQLIQGNSGDRGSASNIVNLLSNSEALAPRDAFSNPLPVFFTHPLRISTDFDPYTDYQEALGLYPAGRPLAPADHPLIAASPIIKAKLDSFEVILVEENRQTLGNTETELTGERITETRSHSHGFSVAVKREQEVSAKPGVKWSVEVKQENKWGFSSAKTIENRQSFSTHIQNATATQSDCFAKLSLNLSVENLGSANASNVSVAINLFIGEKKSPWKTVVVDNSTFGNLFLAPGDSHAISVLRDDAQACLTIHESNFLAQGGAIAIETIVADGQVDFYDVGSNIIQQGGSWQTYSKLINQNLNRLRIDVAATNGERINDYMRYVAPDNTYKNLNLTVEQVLAIAYPSRNCTYTTTDDVCFRKPNGQEFFLGDKTFFDISMFDNMGNQLDLSETLDLLKSSIPTGSTNPLNKVLPPRSVVTIVNNEYEKPQFLHIDMVSALNSVGGDSDSSDLIVNTTVYDFFGIQEVEFCINENNCQKMTSLINEEQDTFVHTGLYTITLPNYTITGNEFLKAKNINDTESDNQSPEAFFFAIYSDLEEKLADYNSHLSSIKERINTLSRIELDNPALYADIINNGLMDHTKDLREQHDRIIERYNETVQSCAVNKFDLLDDAASELTSVVQKCISAIKILDIDIRTTKMKVFNPSKLPSRHLVNVDLNRTRLGEGRGRDAFGANLSQRCELGEFDYLIGIGMGKKNDRAASAIGIKLHYITFDPANKTLSDAKTKLCGENNIERMTTLDYDKDEVTAKIILDTSIRADMAKGDKPYIAEICVSYREFDFQSGQWIGARKHQCNKQQTEDSKSKDGLSNLHGSTGLQNLSGGGNTDLALDGVVVFHFNNRNSFDIKQVFGYHKNPQMVYRPETLHNLDEFEQYRIKHKESGKYLTITSRDSNTGSVEIKSDDDTADQIWTVEPINDREFRVRSKSFENSVLRFEPFTGEIKATKLGENDALEANYLEHFRITRTTDLVLKSYHIRTASGNQVLGANDENHELGVLEDDRGFAFPSSKDSKWIFEPVTTQTPDVTESEVPLSFTFSVKPETFWDNCQEFLLGESYFIRDIRLEGGQSIYNLSERLIKLNDTDHLTMKVYLGPDYNLPRYHEFGEYSKTDRITVCNTFFTADGNLSSFLSGNNITKLTVSAIPAK